MHSPYQQGYQRQTLEGKGNMKQELLNRLWKAYDGENCVNYNCDMH